MTGTGTEASEGTEVGRLATPLSLLLFETSRNGLLLKILELVDSLPFLTF